MKLAKAGRYDDADKMLDAIEALAKKGAESRLVIFGNH